MVTPNAAAIPTQTATNAASFAVIPAPGTYQYTDDHATAAKMNACRKYQPMTGHPISGGSDAP